MANNLYGGYLYPGTPFVFDHIYPNYTEAMRDAAIDGVLIDRFVLIKYCEAALPMNTKMALEIPGTLDKRATQDEKDYVANYQKDGSDKSYDRVVLQKKWITPKEGEPHYGYEEIGNLSVTINDKALIDLQQTIQTFKALVDSLTIEYASDGNGETVDGQILLKYQKDLASTEKEVLASIDVTKFITSGLINSVSVDNTANTIKIEWITASGKQDSIIKVSNLIDMYIGDGRYTNIITSSTGNDITGYKFTLTDSAQRALTWQTFPKPTE